MIKSDDIEDSGVTMCKIVDAEYLGEHSLHLCFNDGTEGDVDLKEHMEHGVFQPLRDPIKFRQFGLEHGTIVWSDQLDIAPEYLYKRVLEQKGSAAKNNFSYFSLSDFR